MSETTIEMPADTTTALDDARPEAVAEPSDVGERRNLYRAGAVLTVVGVLAVGLGLTPSLITVARVLVILAGLVALYMGVRRLGLARFGSDFDLSFILSCAWLAVLITMALLAPLMPLAEHEDTAKTLTSASYAQPSLFSTHPLGTNNFGLDLLARSIYGARYSLAVALSAVLLGMIVGGAIGIVAGYFGGKIDRIVGVLTNSLLAVPSLILLIALASVLEPNLRNISFALSILAIPTMARIARANTLVFSQREFVLAARAMGATRLRVMLREIAPNVALPLASMGMVLISAMIVAEASLSFLGLGIQPPTRHGET